MATRPDPAFYSHVARELVRGRLTPFLGAGINMSDDEGDAFVPRQRLPSGKELARQLVREFDYPGDEPEPDLVRVAQWVVMRLDTGALYEYLHELFDFDYSPTPVHRLLAKMPEYVRQNGGLEYPLVLSTNYDDLLERAFADVHEEFDLLTYVANGPNQGKFLHTEPSGQTRVIEHPNRYRGVTLRDRAAIAKIHGAVARGATDPDRDSYVVTEDDYIDCLTRTDIVHFLPPGVVQRMQRCHYLFLGYSLKDWNLRAILHRIRRDRALDKRSWVINPHPDVMEEKAWENRKVATYDLGVEEFARNLVQRMGGATGQREGVG